MGNGLASPLPVLTLPPAFAGCTTPTVFENSILTAAAAVPVLLALAPVAVWVMTRSVDKTRRLLRAPSLWAAVMNSVIWVLFAFIAAKRVECMELVLAYPILLTLNFTYLLVLYGYRKNMWMASILSLMVLSCLGYVFYAIKFEDPLPMSWETILGIVGLLMLLFSHGCLIGDIMGAVGLLEYAISFLNIVPPGFLNMATCYVILKKHPEQQYIAYSGLIGFLCAILELMLLMSKAIHDKFFGGNNGPPAPPPDPMNVEALAQAAAASAAQVAAAEARVEAIVGQIAEVLAHLEAAAGQQQRNVGNNGDDLSGIIVVPDAERPAGGQLQSNTAQDLGSRLQEEGYDLGDSKGTVNSKKDLPIRKLPEEVPVVPGEVKTAELEKKMTLQPQSGTGDISAAELEKAKSAITSLQSGCSGNDVKKVELGKNEKPQSGTGDIRAAELDKAKSAITSLQSGSSGNDVKKVELGKNERLEACDESKSLKRSAGSCTPRGWRKYLFQGNRPQTC